MKNLKQLRKECGITVRQVLDAYGDQRMDMPLFSKVEAGTVAYPARLYKTVLNLCGVSSAGLTQDDDANENRELASALKMIMDNLKEDEPTPRDYLCTVTGLPDRTMREYLAMIPCVVNMQDGRGYVLTNDLDMMERHYRQERRRAISILRRIKPERAILRQAGRL